MAIAPEILAHILFKKSAGKGSTDNNREFFEEPINGKIAIFKDQVWTESDLIPSTAPVLAPDAILGVVQYKENLSLVNVAGAPGAFQSNDLKDIIPFNFDNTGSYNYIIKDSLGNNIPFGLGDWLVDGDTGTLTFYGTVPANMPPTISFYKYVGTKGDFGSGGSQSFSDTLAIDPTSNGNNVVMSIGDLITDVSGDGEINFSSNNLLIKHFESQIKFNNYGGAGFGAVSISSDNTGNSNQGNIFLGLGAATMQIIVSPTLKGAIGMIDNSATDATLASFDAVGSYLGAKDALFKAGIFNSPALGGTGSIIKTANTAYLNKLAFNSGESFETLLDYTTPTSDNTITLQDGSGTLAFLSDVGPTSSFSDTLAIDPTSNGNNVVMSDNDLIKAENGNSTIDTRFGGVDNTLSLYTGSHPAIGISTESYIDLTPTGVNFGHGGSFLSMADSGSSQSIFFASHYDFFGKDVGLMNLNQSSAYIQLRKAGFGKTGHFGMENNDVASTTTANVPNFPANIVSQNAKFNTGIIGSVALGGNDMIIKTNGTPYLNKLAFNSGESFETLLDYTIPTADNTITLQDGSGTLAFLSDVGAGGSVLTILDKELAPLASTGDDSDTGVTISLTPPENSLVEVVVNGLSYVVGNGVTNKSCYFEDPTVPGVARVYNGANRIVSGDKLIWNGIINEFNLETDDTLSLYYSE